MKGKAKGRTKQLKVPVYERETKSKINWALWVYGLGLAIIAYGLIHWVGTQLTKVDASQVVIDVPLKDEK